MAQSTKLDSYLNQISEALHSPDFNTDNFLKLIVNVLADFSQDDDFKQYQSPTRTDVGEDIPTVHRDTHSRHVPSGDAASHPSSDAAGHPSSDASSVDDPWQAWDTGADTGHPSTASAADQGAASSVTHSTTTPDGFHVDHAAGTLVNGDGSPVNGLTARITTPDDVATQTAINPDFYHAAANAGADMIRLDVVAAVEGRTIEEQIPYIQQAIDAAKSAGLGVQLEFSQNSVSFDRAESMHAWSILAPMYANDKAVTYETANEPGWPGYSEYLLDDLADVYHVMRDAAPDKPIGVLDFPVIDNAADALDNIHGMEARGVDFNDQTTVAFHGYSANGMAPAIAVRDAGYAVQMTEVTDYLSEPVLQQMHDAGIAAFDLAGGFGMTNPDPAGDPRGAYLETFTQQTAPALKADGVDWNSNTPSQSINLTQVNLTQAEKNYSPSVEIPQAMTETANSTGALHAANIIANINPAPIETINLDASNKLTDTFDDGLGSFNHVWGDVQAHNGYIELTSPAATHENASAMIQPGGADSGTGYGLYEFTLSTSSDAPGPYALLWPATDTWPGPEIDVFEMSGGNPFSTVHWNAGGNDAYDYEFMPGSIDTTQPHTYAVDWSEGALTFYFDGQPYRTVTDNVPQDYAHGGQNAVPGIGELTGHWPDQNPQDNSIRLYEFNYTAHSPVG